MCMPTNMNFNMTQPLIFVMSYPKQFWSLINIRQLTNLKAKYFFQFFSIFKNWLPEQKKALKSGSQILISEQNVAL